MGRRDCMGKVSELQYRISLAVKEGEMPRAERLATVLYRSNIMGNNPACCPLKIESFLVPVVVLPVGLI